MSFVRAKEIPPRSGNWYDYLVETTHNKGKVQQKVIQYLGKSGSSAISTGIRSLKHIPQFTKSTDGSIVVKQSKSKTKVVCKFCNGQHTRKYGTYKVVTQYYYCDDCNKKFVGTDALAGGRVSPEFIASALKEYYDGLSFHDIEHNIENQTDTDISHTAVNKWVNKYTDEAIQKTKDLHPKVGDTWIADETYIRIDKSKDRVVNPYDKSRKAKWVVFWDIIDADTRFLLASHVTSTRHTQDVRTPE